MGRSFDKNPANTIKTLINDVTNLTGSKYANVKIFLM